MIQKSFLAFVLIACLLLPGFSSAREEQACFFQTEEEFTDRDKRDTYDEEDCVKIFLNGSSGSLQQAACTSSI